MSGPATGEKLPEDVLARRATLPVKVAPVVLDGNFVRLEPLNLDRDASALYAVSNGQPAELGDRSVDAYDSDALIWRYMPAGPFTNLEEYRAYLQALIDMPDGLAMCVFHQATGRQVGVTTFMSNAPAHLKIELGNIWYSPLVQRTPANLESTSLMLRHAFTLGYRRLEWKCNALNERSRRAALRMGFTFEGVQDAHLIVKGLNRDTAWFRILDSEWPGVRAQLEAMLDRQEERPSSLLKSGPATIPGLPACD
jgi:RimJ/RimL family protein N-acetyltransferase